MARAIPILFALAWALQPAMAGAQEATGALIGIVQDAGGGVLRGASVRVSSPALIGGPQTLTTNEQGQFTVPAVQPGAYTVTVTLDSFKTAVVGNVRVNAGVPASVKVAMEIGGLNETVTVAGGSEIVQTQSASVSTTIDTNQILKLPTGSRSALSFVTTSWITFLTVLSL